MMYFLYVTGPFKSSLPLCLCPHCYYPCPLPLLLSSPRSLSLPCSQSDLSKAPIYLPPPCSESLRISPWGSSPLESSPGFHERLKQASHSASLPTSPHLLYTPVEPAMPLMAMTCSPPGLCTAGTQPHRHPCPFRNHLQEALPETQLCLTDYMPLWVPMGPGIPHHSPYLPTLQRPNWRLRSSLLGCHCARA